MFAKLLAGMAGQEGLEREDPPGPSGRTWPVGWPLLQRSASSSASVPGDAQGSEEAGPSARSQVPGLRIGGLNLSLGLGRVFSEPEDAAGQTSGADGPSEAPPPPSSRWRAVPFLPALVDAIVGTPPEDHFEAPFPEASGQGELSGARRPSRRNDDSSEPAELDSDSPWLSLQSTEGDGAGREAAQAQARAAPSRPLGRQRSGEALDVTEPHALAFSEPSALLEPFLLHALFPAVPARFRSAGWELAYSTLRDGISFGTLLRSARGRAPCFLLVRDSRRAVFGAYCSEAWRLSAQTFGTGETFVFCAGPGEPRVWRWWWERHAQEPNDYFMRGTAEGLAVGGAGGFALWLDNELARGLSRPCLTFGSPCLASSQEFNVGAVELWAAS